MATTLTPVPTTRTPGIDYAVAPIAADAAGNNWKNSGAETFWISNGGGSPITLTQHFGVMATIDGVAPANRTISVPAGHAMEFGPFPPSQWNDSNGFMLMTYSAVTTVSVLVKFTGS
jgi:hypothetical protein